MVKSAKYTYFIPHKKHSPMKTSHAVFSSDYGFFPGGFSRSAL